MDPYECNCCQPKDKKEMHRKIYEMIKESKWGASRKYM